MPSKDPDVRKAQRRAYYQKNKESAIRRAGEYNKKLRIEGKCRACKKPLDAGSQFCSVCKIKEKLRLVVTKRMCMDAYGGNCVCCGETFLDFLCLDHIYDDGFKDRKEGTPKGVNLYVRLKKLGFPKGKFQVLCANCNLSKHINGGMCGCKRA